MFGLVRRRLSLFAVVLLVACGSPPNPVETEADLDPELVLTSNLTLYTSPSNAKVALDASGGSIDIVSANASGGRRAHFYYVGSGSAKLDVSAQGSAPFNETLTFSEEARTVIEVKLSETQVSRTLLSLDAGQDRTVVAGETLKLKATTSSRGLEGDVRFDWRLVDSPLDVTLERPNSAEPETTFQAPGSYVFQVYASLGSLKAADRVTVTVKEGDPAGPQEPQGPQEPTAPDPQEPKDPEPDAPASGAPLIDSYFIHRMAAGHLEKYYRGVSYHPRQSNVPGYENWDRLKLPRSTYQRANWLNVNLNRNSRLVIVWEHTATWLADWKRAKVTVNGREMNTYTKDVRAGALVLHPPGPSKTPYTLLLAEEGGKVSSAPALPKGISESERPVANQVCPSWVHDRYLAEGPEGGLYHSWHPQIDPVYWCYFTHEHGSDPSLVNYEPSFKYVADKNYRQNEQHEGFKGFAYRDEAQGVGWYVNVHMTTSAPERLCARFHTVVFAATDLKTGELLAEVGYKADFGSLQTSASFMVDGKARHLTVQPKFAPNCPNQAAIRQETDGNKWVKIIPSLQNTIDPGRYEKWHASFLPSLGMRGDRQYQIVNRTPQYVCPDVQCSQAKRSNDPGTTRMWTFGKLKWQYDSKVAAFDRADGKRDGVFWTNVYGTELAEPGGVNSIRQYVKPGTNLYIAGALFSDEAFSWEYKMKGRVLNLELEEAIGNEN